MILDKEHFIGQGANWEIYRINEQSNTVIIRVPKFNFGNKINDYLNNYNIVKSTGLPALSRVERTYYDNVEVVLTEDLNNNQNRIYVSPNSVITDTQKQLNEIQRLQFDHIKDIGDSPDAEKYRLEHKLDQITDFDLFLDTAKNDIWKASQLDVFVAYDCYFFGSEMHAVHSAIDYKIVDFDDIETNTKRKTNKLYEINITEFKQAATHFIDCFVNDGQQKNAYLEAVQNL